MFQDFDENKRYRLSKEESFEFKRQKQLQDDFPSDRFICSAIENGRRCENHGRFANVHGNRWYCKKHFMNEQKDNYKFRPNSIDDLSKFGTAIEAIKNGYTITGNPGLDEAIYKHNPMNKNKSISKDRRESLLNEFCCNLDDEGRNRIAKRFKIDRSNLSRSYEVFYFDLEILPMLI